MSTIFKSNNITIRAFQTLIDRFADYPDYLRDDYLSDLHNELYNSDYEYIYYSDAVKDLEEYGVFDAIEEVKEYEEFNFGEVNTDFSNPCNVANMLFYIIGEKIIYEVVQPIIEAQDNDEPDFTAIKSDLLDAYNRIAA